jgi:hypothetical protein
MPRGRQLTKISGWIWSLSRRVSILDACYDWLSKASRQVLPENSIAAPLAPSASLTNSLSLYLYTWRYEVSIDINPNIVL